MIVAILLPFLIALAICCIVMITVELDNTEDKNDEN